MTVPRILKIITQAARGTAVACALLFLAGWAMSVCWHNQVAMQVDAGGTRASFTLWTFPNELRIEAARDVASADSSMPFRLGVSSFFGSPSGLTYHEDLLVPIPSSPLLLWPGDSTRRIVSLSASACHSGCSSQSHCCVSCRGCADGDH